MKKVLVVMAFLLAAGLLCFWQWRQNARHLAVLQQQTTKLQREIGQLRQEGLVMHQQAETLRSNASAVAAQALAMRQQVEDERAYAAQEKKRYIGAAYIAEGFQVADQIKTMIAEYYMEMGHWPDSNHELGLPAPDAYKARALRGMNVSHDGVIVLTYAAVEGVDAGEIRLAPRYDEQTRQIKWRCESPSYSRISSIVAECTYVGPKTSGSVSGTTTGAH
jgi:cell division protein FtsB